MSVDRGWLAAQGHERLLGRTLPFWLRHGHDREHGGFVTCLDRDGRLLDDDKAIWLQGRAAWTFAEACHTFGERPDWRAACLDSVAFLQRHGFDERGRMPFLVTRDGRPLRRRRYAYSECFAALGFANAARLTGDATLAARAVELAEAFAGHDDEPQRFPPKWEPDVRPREGLAPRMMALCLAQGLRAACDWPGAEALADRALADIQRLFVKPDLGAVLELATPDGDVIEHLDGRTLNPGHALEAAWFVLAEARARDDDAELTALGLAMAESMWARGWDREHGGILGLVDVHGGPVQETWADMKFWWPQAEAALACLAAWRATGAGVWAERLSDVLRWIETHLADAEHGEWFGYAHRDGRLANTLKGGHWKGPFHVPRMELLLGRWLGDVTG